MRRLNPAYIAYAHDIVMAALSVGLSLFLRMGDTANTLPTGFLVVATILFTIIAAAVFWPMGLYRGVWRYSSMSDMVQITKAVTVTMLIFVPVMFVMTRAEFVPRSFPVINWLVLLLLLGGPRFAYRLFRDRRIDWSIERGQRPRVPVLLIGAGDDAETFIRAMARHHNRTYRIVGVVDEKGNRTGRYIHTVKVLGSLNQLDDILARLKRRNSLPQRLIVTKQHLPRATMRHLFDRAEAHGMALSRLPALTDFHDDAGEDGGGVLDIRPVDVADLLGRPQAVLDRPAMQGLIAGRRVMVTGAGGTIGSELVRQIAALDPAELCLLDNGEFNLYAAETELAEKFPTVRRHAVLADVRDATRLADVFATAKPELVFHAAAMKHVPIVEANPTEGVLTNAVGTRNIADACRNHGVAAMVLISTDKAVNPTSVMGASKRAAEGYCQALSLHRAGADSRFVTVRFGNVLGSTGSVVPLFQRQLANGGPLTVTHPDMSRYFMTTREAVELVLQATASSVANATDEPGAIFVLDMGEPVKIVDLANQMIRLANKDPGKDIEIEFIGLRPGEKLHEQLFHQGEPLTRTDMQGIRLATPRTADLQLLSRQFDDLEQAARGGDATATTAVLARIVPEYDAALPTPTSRAAAAT